MYQDLLIVERIILESLLQKPRNIQELFLDTKLNHHLIQNILTGFLNQNIVKYSRGTYRLNDDERDNWLHLINHDSTVKAEVKDLFISLVNHYFRQGAEAKKSCLRMKKIWMSAFQEKHLNQLLFEVERFIKQIEHDNKTKIQNKRTHKKKVIIWGHSQYEYLIGQQLMAI